LEHMGRAIRPPLSRDFFTPTARRWKGKEKAVGLSDLDYAQCAECAEWLLGSTHDSCCAVRHSVWCPSAYCAFYSSSKADGEARHKDKTVCSRSVMRRPVEYNHRIVPQVCKIFAAILLLSPRVPLLPN
jgi:hypothetical protein